MSLRFDTKDEAIRLLEQDTLGCRLSDMVKAGLRKLTLDQLESLIEETEEATRVIWDSGEQFGRRRCETEEDIVQMLGVNSVDAANIRRYVENVDSSFIFRQRRSGDGGTSARNKQRFEEEVRKAYELLKDGKIAPADMVPDKP